MIVGSCSFSNSGKTSTFLDLTQESTVHDAIFYNVADRDFKGGYYLLPSLPLTHYDYFFSDEANDIRVLLAGTVYNRSELLVKLNLSMQIPDPELIARLFLMEGPAFVSNLNGDFAISLSRPGKKELFLFRDHVGICPLAWIIENETLFFSSHIIGLCRAFSSAETINKEYLLGYFKYINYRTTPAEKVTKLLPGHFLHFSEKGIRIEKYWEPEKIRTDKTLTYNQMIADLKLLVNDAVRIRCDDHFSAGAHVSGGLDSGIVSALARKGYSRQKKFYGFSWSPAEYKAKEVKYDEREIVINSCKKTEISPLLSRMKQVDFTRAVSSFYDNQGYFSEALTAEKAAEVNTNLIFSGWGGDEFISTGDRGIEQDLLWGLNLRVFFRRNPVKNLRSFFRNLLVYVIFPALGILTRDTKKSFRDDARYIKVPFQKSYRKAIRNFYFHTSRHRLHLGRLKFYHLQERCESWAVNGFRNGIVYRYPLLDKRIIEYMLKVPSSLLCQTGHFRPILRDISEGILPEEVRWNKHKNDPVYWAWMTELFEESAISFMQELNVWRINPDLNFIDFERLAADIEKYNKMPGNVDQKVLFRSLVYIKAVYEFIKRYRNGN